MAFDPHYVWLGIPPNEQPPNHYRLLGINQYEDNLDAISHAGDRLMAHVRTFQAGPHAADSQRLLREISEARICLLDPEKKSAYDAALKATLRRERPRTSVLPVQNSALLRPIPMTAPLVPVVVQAEPPAVAPPPAVAARKEERLRSLAPRRDAQPLVETAKIVAGGLAGIAISVLLLWLVFQIDVTGLFSRDRTNDATRLVEQQDDSFHRPPDPPSGAPLESGGTEANVASTAVESGASPEAVVGREVEPSVVEPAVIDREQQTSSAASEITNGPSAATASPEAAAASEPPTSPMPSPTTGSAAAESRQVWVHRAGGFRQVGPRKWIERFNDVILNFEEVGRNGEFIEIRRDPNTFVRLYGDHSDFKPATATQFRRLYGGSWKPATTPLPSIIAEQRQPVPSAEALLPVMKTLDSVYGLSKLKDEADRIRVAGELLKDAEKPATNSIERFALLRQAVALATEARDATLALEAVDTLARAFEAVDPSGRDQLDFETELIEKLALAVRKAPEVGALVKATQPSIRFAQAEGRYDLAKQMTDSVHRACSRPIGRAFLKNVAELDREIERQYLAWRSYEAALQKLQANSADSEALLDAAKWLVVERSDWPLTIALLAKAGGQVGEAAELDQAGAVDAEALVAVADAWYDAGTVDSPDPLWRMRAAMLYARADKTQLSGLSAAKVDRRLNELLNDKEVAALAKWVLETPGIARTSDKLPPIVRRHCVLLFTFEPDDVLPQAETSTLRDLSGQRNHGRIAGPVPALGKAGRAFQFDGQDDFVECLNQPSLNMVEAISICAWVLQQSPVHPGGADDIVSKDQWGNRRGAGFVLRFHNRAPDFNFGNGPDWFFVRSPQVAEPGNWMHLAAVYDGQHEVLLVDGVEVASRRVAKSIDPAKSKLRIGRGSFAQDRCWNGLIDEVAIFDMALAAADIRTIYELGSQGQPLSR